VGVKSQLIAVQADMRLEHYLDAAAFRDKIMALTEEAVAGGGDMPKLIAFPEAIGFPLVLTLGSDLPRLSRFTNFRQAALGVARASWRDLLGLAVRKNLRGLGALYHLQAVPAYLGYRGAFRDAARYARATVVAGTIFLPHIEEEGARGVHIASQAVFNTALTFGPHGTILDRTRKCYLTPGAESRAGLACAPLSELHTFETPLGRVGVAICLDGFFSSVLERLDGLGARVVVQPSANHASWDRPWPPDPGLREGEAWFAYGLRALIQDRLHLQYGVNPMLVGEVLDLVPRGRSSIVANRQFHQGEMEGLEGLLAVARTDDQEEVVRAVVDLV
jgi:predicted amidohydrolase